MIKFIKRAISVQFKNFTTYRKFVNIVRKSPRLNMKEVKIKGIFKRIEMKVRIDNDTTYQTKRRCIS